MRYYLAAFCLLSLSMSAQAQSMNMKNMFPEKATYYIKGGSEIPYAKIDSVIASWGGKFNMEHQGEKIYLSATTADDQKATDNLKLKASAWIGKPAPDFRLFDVKGKSYSLSELKGKIVVLNFWFTSCAPCIAEMPELNHIKETYKHKNIVFLALARDSKLLVKLFLERHKFDYHLLTDAAQTAADYQVSTYPTSMVIDEKGIVRFAQVSGQNIMANLSGAIDSL